MENDDPQRLVKVTAHAIARVSDRFTFLRKISRHAEGQERKAGLLSDIIAAAVTLYQRNPDVVKMLATGLAQEVKDKRATAAAEQERAKAQTMTPQNGGVHSHV